MSETRTRFPRLDPGYGRAMGSEPILLDGMEVLFDETVGLYPVNLDAGEPTRGPEQEDDGPTDGRTDGEPNGKRRGNGRTR